MESPKITNEEFKELLHKYDKFYLIGALARIANEDIMALQEKIERLEKELEELKEIRKE